MSTDREANEAWVAALIADYSHSPKIAAENLMMFAALLRQDALPKAGRDWVADQLEELAVSGKVFLPRQRKKRKARTDIDVWGQVQRERAKRDASHGDMGGKDGVYARVGRRNRHRRVEKDVSRTTKNEASKGLKQLQRVFNENVAKGMAPEVVIASLAKRLRLPVSTLQKSLFPRPFVK